jgi:hypothetical protein
MTVAELIEQLQQLNPNAIVVQSQRAEPGAYSPTDLAEAGLYEAATDRRGTFWVPEDEQPWNPEPFVDEHAVCLWAASWPRGENDETGA